MGPCHGVGVHGPWCAEVSYVQPVPSVRVGVQAFGNQVVTWLLCGPSHRGESTWLDRWPCHSQQQGGVSAKQQQEPKLSAWLAKELGQGAGFVRSMCW